MSWIRELTEWESGSQSAEGQVQRGLGVHLQRIQQRDRGVPLMEQERQLRAAQDHSVDIMGWDDPEKLLPAFVADDSPRQFVEDDGVDIDALLGSTRVNP